MPTMADSGAGVPEIAEAALVLDRMDEGFYAIDREWRLLYVNPRAEVFWGLSRAQLLGRSMLALFPQFEGSAPYRAHAEAMSTGLPVEVETISTATNAPVRLRIFPSGRGASVYFHDITQSRQMQADLETRDALLRLAESSAGVGVWVADLQVGTMTGTPQFFSLLGLEPPEGPVSQDFTRRFRHPDDRERVTQGFHDALASGTDVYETEYRIVRPSGEVRWIFGRGRVSRDAEGRPKRYSGVDIDITERKKQDEHLRMVMRELLHRTDNLLTVVQGLSRQTAHRSTSLEEFDATFTARLKGLGESSALLTRQDWRGAPLNELILAQSAPFAAPARFVLEGPAVLLSPKATQNLGLAFHELCTNAIKYGALSQPEGRVAVHWEVGADPEGSLDLVWTEAGGPPVKPPRRSGFGRVVSEKMLARALGAEVTTDFAPSGLVWRLRLPAGEFTRKGPDPPPAAPA
jgi:PAS domain S-box-containing protein